MAEVKVGERYEQQKGGVYEVIAIAKHTETTDEMVVYRRQSDGEVYARPKPIFEGDRKGKPRFMRVVRDEIPDDADPPPGWERYTVTDDDGCSGESLHVRRVGPDTVTVQEAWRQHNEARRADISVRLNMKREAEDNAAKIERLESSAVNLKWEAADAERRKKHWKVQHANALEGTKLAEARVRDLSCVHSDCGKCLACDNYCLNNNIRVALDTIRSLIARAIPCEVCGFCGSSWATLGAVEAHDETCPVTAARELLEVL